MGMCCTSVTVMKRIFKSSTVVALQFFVLALQGLHHLQEFFLLQLSFGNEGAVHNVSFGASALHCDAAAMRVSEELLQELAAMRWLALGWGVLVEIVIDSS